MECFVRCRPLGYRENVSMLHTSISLSGFVGPSCYVFRPPRGVSNMVVLRWNHVFSRVQATHGGYLTWRSWAGTTCFHVSPPPRGYLTWCPRAGTTCFYVSGQPMGYRAWLPRAASTCFFECRPPRGGYLTWLPRAGTKCFTCPGHPGGVSNMVVPSWNHVFPSFPTTQWGI